MKALPQTPRRSKRGQPIATPSRTKPDSTLRRAWVCEPLYTRPANPALDYTNDDQDERAEQDEEDEEYETVFYRSFEMQKAVQPKAFRAKGKGKKKEGDDNVETYAVGDTVLIKTDELSLRREPPSIGVIVAMWETRKMDSDEEFDSDRMRLRMHWFLRPAVNKPQHYGMKREHTKNEIYYSLAQSGITFPELILGRCTVTSVPPKSIQIQEAGGTSRPASPTKRKGRIYTQDSDDEDETDGKTPKFYCRYANNGQNVLYYDFNWEDHHLSAQSLSSELPSDVDLQWGNGGLWDVDASHKNKRSSRQAAGPSRPRKKPKLETIESESEGNGTEDEFVDGDASEASDDDSPSAASSDSPASETDDDFGAPKTPSKKKRKRGVLQNDSRPSSPTKRTPRKPRTKTVVHPTPHSKALLRNKSRQSAGLGTPSRKRGVGKFAVTQQAVDNAAQEDLSHLPKDPWLRAMHVLHVGSRPDALPCREEEFDKVLRCVEELLEEGSGGCVYISGVPGTGKTATVHAVVRQLKRMAESGEANPFTYVEINGLRIPEPSAAYNFLWEGVSGHDISQDGHLRIGTKESLKALTRYFSGGGRIQGPGGHACIVLMDELDQLVTAKQDVVYNFFNWPTLAGSKLIVIAVANTMDLPERVMTGRVRSRLGMIRINFQPYTTAQLEKIVQARLECARTGMGEAARDVVGPDAIKFASMKVSSISGDARRVLDICRRTVELVHATQKTARVGEVKEVIQLMQNSPTAAYLRDCSFHERMMLASLVKCVKREGVEEIKWGEVEHQHLLYMNVLTSDDDPKRKPTPTELQLVLESLAASRAILVEDGMAVARKPEGERKVLLNLEQNEVERVLSEVGGVRWKNVLST